MAVTEAPEHTGSATDARHLAAPDARNSQSRTVTSASDTNPPSPESRMNRIARRAHEIYEARGGQDGKALEDWLQAEREIDNDDQPPPG
jgi:Protein of unknown function (DUF2934)